MSVSLYVCFPHNISKTSAARITKLDIDIVHHECWKPIYFVVKGQGHAAQKNTSLLVWSSERTQYWCLLLSNIRTADAADRQFSMRGVLCSQTVPAWVSRCFSFDNSWRSIAPGCLGDRCTITWSIPWCSVGIRLARPWSYIVVI